MFARTSVGLPTPAPRRSPGDPSGPAGAGALERGLHFGLCNPLKAPDRPMATPAAAAVTAPTDAPEAPAKKKGGKLVPMILGVVLLAGAGGGAWYFMNHGKATSEQAGEEGGHGAPAEGTKSDATFVPLESAFVVNLEDEDAMRFMQVEVQVVVHDPKAVDLIKNNMPIVRNRLMLLFSGQHYRDLNTRAAKEKLQADALAEVQKALTEVTGKPQVEALYFTSMVMQ